LREELEQNQFVPVARVSDVPEGQGRAFNVGRYEVAVFRIAGAFHALENACPHQGGPLAEGAVEGMLVTCPWHAWCFDVRSGKMTLGDFASVPRFEVRVRDDLLLLACNPAP